MKKKRFGVEQIVGVLKQAEVGVPVVELIRKVGISEQTFYRWKAKYVGLEVDQVRQMKQLQEENLRLKGAGTSALQGTFPFSINTAGDITGTYLDGSYAYHGFVRTP